MSGIVFLPGDDVFSVGIQQPHDGVVPRLFLVPGQHLRIGTFDVVGHGNGHEFVGNGFHDDRVGQRAAAKVPAGLAARDFVEKYEQWFLVGFGFGKCGWVVPQEGRFAEFLGWHRLRSLHGSGLQHQATDNAHNEEIHRSIPNWFQQLWQSPYRSLTGIPNYLRC